MATPASGPRAKKLATDDKQAPGPRAAKAPAAQQQQQATQDKIFRVLYLFSGKPRKHDMTSCLQEVCRDSGYKLSMECMHIQRKPRIDLSYSKQRKRILDKIRSGSYDVILMSPPCSTFTRAVWANFKGPRPVRSYQKPRGLDSLTSAERDKAILGNIFADFCCEVIMATLDTELSFLLMEQPEDLGAMRYGPRMGQRPSSMWQWPQLAKVRDKPGYVSCALHQSELGASYPKPTRLLLKTRIQRPTFWYLGAPSFDSQGYYTGPLPWLRAWAQPFKTSGTDCCVPMDSLLGGGFLDTTSYDCYGGVERGVPE